MALKKLIFGLLLTAATISFSEAQNQDSVVYQVFYALTTDEVVLPKNVDQLLDGHEWETLAYWDVNEPKEMENMHEAVGDIYQFIAKQFVIKAVDPNSPTQYLSAITGTFRRDDNALVLSSQSGKEMVVFLIHIDEHYLVLEIEGLRIFFTQTKSYNPR